MQTSTARVETFSDSVIAIIITIMILELKMPDFKSHQSQYSIEKHLMGVLPYLAAYIFSFVMIGILWINHHHLFHLLQKTDNFLLGQNLFFLFWMSLIPFVTGNIGANPVLPVSTALYGFIMLMTSLSLSWMRSYTLKKELVHTDEERMLRKKIFQIVIKGKNQSYISSVLYLISIPVAYISVYLAYCLFLVPIILFLIPAGIEEEKLTNKMIEKNS